MKTVDITPTWEAILPALLAVIENGNFEGRKVALEELTRMAQLADLYVKQESEIERLTKLENCVRSIPDGVHISNIQDKVWQVLYAHDELISPEERVFVVGILNELEGMASDDVERNVAN
jgi:hypothetical protein